MPSENYCTHHAMFSKRILRRLGIVFNGLCRVSHPNVHMGRWLHAPAPANGVPAKLDVANHLRKRTANGNRQELY